MSLVRLERRGAVAVITLDRPPVNALSRELVSDLAAAIDGAGDPRPRRGGHQAISPLGQISPGSRR
jgi:enoyl-CoA hydratase/carnithine racemase